MTNFTVSYLSVKNISVKLKAFLRRPGVYISFLLIWLLALFFIFFPKWSSLGSLFLSLSTVILALGRPSFEAMVKAAMVFWLYWTTLTLYLTLFNLIGQLDPSVLAVKLALGLHLILLWTPMELGRALNRVLRVFIGSKRAGLFSLGLVVILKVLPGLMVETQKLKTTIEVRAGHLNFFSRLILLARNLLRLESQRSEELIRALLAR